MERSEDGGVSSSTWLMVPSVFASTRYTPSGCPRAIFQLRTVAALKARRRMDLSCILNDVKTRGDLKETEQMIDLEMEVMKALKGRGESKISRISARINLPVSMHTILNREPSLDLRMLLARSP